MMRKDPYEKKNLFEKELLLGKERSIRTRKFYYEKELG